MRYVEIAGVDRPVSTIGLGTTSSIFGPDGDDRVAELIEAFLDAGGNSVDTAQIYGSGESERALGRWLEDSGRRDEVFLITKGCHPDVHGDDWPDRPWVPRVTPEAITFDLRESLERLRTEHIDLYLLHRDDESVPPGPLVEALNYEQERGRIAAFGASNWTVDRITEANEYAEQQGLNGFVVNSPGLSLARPTTMYYPGTLFAEDDTRRWHADRQFPMLAWSTLAAGFAAGTGTDPSNAGVVARAYFSDENFERRRRAEEIGQEKGFSGLQIALAFVLCQPYPVVALVGPSKIPNLEANLGALDVELTPEEMAYLDLSD